jgi:hypothetical protein
VLIDAGQLTELRGWWNAGEECRKRWKGNASAYARQASKDSEEYAKKKRVRPHSETTIRQYIGAMMKAQEIGYSLRDFDCVDDVRQRVASASTKSKREPVVSGKRTINATTRKAYDALMSTPEFRALPKHEKALIRKLRNGESFHTNIG